MYSYFYIDAKEKYYTTGMTFYPASYELNVNKKLPGFVIMIKSSIAKEIELKLGLENKGYNRS